HRRQRGVPVLARVGHVGAPRGGPVQVRAVTVEVDDRLGEARGHPNRCPPLLAGGVGDGARVEYLHQRVASSSSVMISSRWACRCASYSARKLARSRSTDRSASSRHTPKPTERLPPRTRVRCPPTSGAASSMATASAATCPMVGAY